VLLITAPALVEQDWGQVSAQGWALLGWCAVVPV
jgi:hypothetical protein